MDVQVYVVVVVVVVVVAVMTSPPGSAYMVRQTPRRDEEFHKIRVVLKYIFDVSAVTEMMLTFHGPQNKKNNTILPGV